MIETNGGGIMGLKFKQDNILDQKFDAFAFLPDENKDKKVEEQDLERFLHPETKKEEDKKENN
ncbi:hypothetical protein GCM10025885_06180 [Tetragenococcus osmophilus]|uniref:Uncharacterized protein n=2 Tax=Tetragenococcus osmophilus TaxID=526944 RepID=A0AA37XK63_9ENTE|nr:hypothetical protein GCM10025885_06180 [Tetragenococcus osmophilus]